MRVYKRCAASLEEKNMWFWFVDFVVFPAQALWSGQSEVILANRVPVGPPGLFQGLAILPPRATSMYPLLDRSSLEE